MKEEIRLKIEKLKEIDSYTPEQVNAALDELSKEFKPDSVNYLLDLENDHSLEDTSMAALKAVSRLRIFVESNHDEDVAKEIGYGKVMRY